MTVSTVRFVARLDGDVAIDETYPHQQARMVTVGKSFTVEVLGERHQVDVEVHFDPPVRA